MAYRSTHPAKFVTVAFPLLIGLSLTACSSGSHGSAAATPTSSAADTAAASEAAVTPASNSTTTSTPMTSRAFTSMMTTGNALLTPVSNSLGNGLDNTQAATNNTLSPLSSQSAVEAAGIQPASVTVINDSALSDNDPASQQLVGVSALSQTPATGQLASATALAAGSTAQLGVGQGSGASTTGGAANSLLGANAGSNSILGSSTQPLVAANVLASSPASGSLATANILNSDGGQPVSASVAGISGTPARRIGLLNLR